MEGEKELSVPFNVTKANAETILYLMLAGVLEVGESGLTVTDKRRNPHTDRKSKWG